MALHDDLLHLARHLVDRNPGAPVEAALRRAVSTAYYALFHLLIHESTTRIVAIPGMWPRVVRAFDHGDMKKICKDYSAAVYPAGQPNPQEIQNVAGAFVTLQAARHLADYDTSIAITYADANSNVQLAENSFADWAAVRTNPAVDGFLTDLLFQSIRKR
jgi:hypothetical protein